MKLIKSFIIILILFSSCSYDKSILDTAISSAIVNQSNTTIPLEVRNRGIWLIGGSSSASTLSPISGVDLYDPVDNKWYEGITQLPKPVMFAGVTPNNGKIYVIGGMTSAENLTRVVQIFDIESHTWSYGPDFPVAIQGLKAFSIETNVYTVGGSFTNDATGAISRIMKLNKLYNFWLALYDIAGVNTNYRIDAGVSTLENVCFLEVEEILMAHIKTLINYIMFQIIQQQLLGLLYLLKELLSLLLLIIIRIKSMFFSQVVYLQLV